MSIPANALTDEECLNYAALDPAAAELTRRFTSQSIDRTQSVKSCVKTSVASKPSKR
jgi:hypothetical protein